MNLTWRRVAGRSDPLRFQLGLRRSGAVFHPSRSESSLPSLVVLSDSPAILAIPFDKELLKLDIKL